MDSVKVFDVQINSTSVGEFRQSLREAREAMKDAKIGTTEFKQELRKLEEQENKLRNILKLGTDDTYKVGESYNALTRRMSELKSMWRATTDEVQRANLGKEIYSINNRLKELDLTVGDNYRNVGNYVSLWQGLSGAFVQAFPSFGKIEEVIKSTGTATSVFAKILNGTTSVVGLLSKGLKVLKANLLATGLGVFVVALGEAVANWDKLSKVLGITTNADKARQAVEDLNITLDVQAKMLKGQNIDALYRYTQALKEAKGEIALIEEAEKQYNETILQNRLKMAKASLSSAYEAERIAYDAYTKRQNDKTTKALNEAKNKVAELKNEVATIENEMTRNTAEAEAERTESTRREAEERARIRQREAEEQAKAIEAQRAEAERISEYNKQAEADLLALRQKNRPDTIGNNLLTLKEQHAAEMEALQKRNDAERIAEETANALKLETERAYQIQRQEMLAEYQQQEKDNLAEWAKTEAEYWQNVGEAIIQEFEERQALQELDKNRRKEAVKQAQQAADALVQIAGEQTAVGKALAVANTLISTYQSAQMAYQSAFLPVPTVASPALGAISAAAAVVSGLANVKQILSTDASGKSTPNIGGASTPAIVQPPAVVQEVPVTRSLTSASEEERLNKMASDTRVYLVYSDVEQAGKQVEVQQTEASF